MWPAIESNADWPSKPGAPLHCPPPRSLWEALGRCPQLGSRLSAQLDAARTRFLENQLLPALNRQGEEGW